MLHELNEGLDYIEIFALVNELARHSMYSDF